MIQRRQDETYFDQLGPSFENFASDYDSQSRWRMIQSLLATTVLPSDPQVLEIGCGFGAITQGICETNLHPVVSDIGENLVRKVVQCFGELGAVADALQLPFKQDIFDLVISSETVEHVPKPLDAAVEMMRVTKPGGYLLLTSPNPRWGPVITLAEKMGLRKFEGNEIFVSSSRVASHLSGQLEARPEVSGCHLFPWQIPGAKWLLPRIDSWGPKLHPLMINWGLLLQKKKLDCAYN